LVKILISHYALPEIKSFRTIIFEQILQFLKSQNVEIEWFIYMPDKIKPNIREDSKYKILDFHNYTNAVDLIREVKPDIIYASAYPIAPDIALKLAGKHFKIPVVADVVNQVVVGNGARKMIKTNLLEIFQKSVSTDVDENQKKFMRRGRFWIKKYLFLLKTQFAVKMNILKIIYDFFIIFSAHLTWKEINNPKFSVDYHFVEGNALVKKLINLGYDSSSLILTGNPVYDKVFQKLEHPQQPKKNSKIQVLLLTHSLYEHGFWTRKQRDELITTLVTEISKHKDEMSLVVKIHPSSEILSDYEKLIKPIDSSIPIYQKEDMQEFLNNSDVVIVYSTSSGPIQALILKKPIIMVNLDLPGDIMLERKIVTECTDPSKIISSIHQAISSNPATEEKVNNFVSDYLFKTDGLAYERMGKAIIKIAENSQKNKKHE
jgi:hypothetical protein